MIKRLSTSNWPFALKFAVPCAMALIVVLVVEIVAIGAIRSIRDSLSDIVEKKYSASLQLEQDVVRLRAANGDLYLTQLKQAANLSQDIHQETENIQKELDQTLVSLSQFKQQFSDLADIEKIDLAIENVKHYRKAVTFVGSMLDFDFKKTVSFVLPLKYEYDGTINSLSDLSNQFLAKSKTDALEADKLSRRKTSLIAIFSILSFFLVLAITAPLIVSTTRSVRTLADATGRLADGDTSINLDYLERHDELGGIVKALTVFRDNIDRVAELKKVSLLYASMNAMLDSLEQGLCSLGPDGICSDITSKAWIDLFGESPVGRHIADVLGMSGERKELIDSVLGLVFSHNSSIALSAEELLGMLPHKSESDKDEVTAPSISFDYRAIENSLGRPQAILVIANDHAEEIAAERLHKERENKVLMMLRILSDRNQFIKFLQELAYVCQNPDLDFANATMEQLKRDLHTYKGVASTYYLDAVVAALHDVESLVAKTTKIKLIWDDFVAALRPVNEALTEVRRNAALILGDDFDKRGMIKILPVTGLCQLVEEMIVGADIQKIRSDFIQNLFGEPVHKMLAGVESDVRSLSDRYGKGISGCKFAGENFQVVPEIYSDLMASLIHISRNIVDHAVDDPEMRERLGKPSGLTVTVSTERFNNEGADWMRICFTDDGKGIDVEKLRAKLHAKAADHDTKILSDVEIMQHIFDGELSTNDVVTQLSGRGVGLDAVRCEAQRLGGTAYVESVLQKYTKLTIEVPLLWDVKIIKDQARQLSDAMPKMRG